MKYRNIMLILIGIMTLLVAWQFGASGWEMLQQSR